MSNFIGYTIGLECVVGDGIRLVKVEYTAESDTHIRLTAVSGHNLSKIGRFAKVISRESFGDRPVNPYDQTKEAIWALSVLGLTPAALAEAAR